MWNDDGQPPLMGGGHQYPPTNGYSAAPPQMHTPYMNRGGIPPGPAPMMASSQSTAPPPQMGGYWDPSQMIAAPPHPPPQMTMQRQSSGYGGRQPQQTYGGWEQQQMQQQSQWQSHPQQNAQWNAQTMGMMSTPPPPVMGGGMGSGMGMGGGRLIGGGGNMNGTQSGYWNEQQQQGYGMMNDGGHSQHSQHSSHHSHSHHQQQQQHQQPYSSHSSHSQHSQHNRNTWQNDQQQQQQQQQQHQNWNNSGSQSGAYGQWDNKHGGSEWTGSERSNGRRGDQWMNGGGQERHDERMANRFDSNVGSVGSWNPNEMPEEPPSNDMVWRDPNPKQKKPPARDIGTAIWGDPNQQRQVNLWTHPENAAPDFNWDTFCSPNTALSGTGLGWDDPIPSDRASRASDIQKNISNADSAADLAHVSNQLATAVDKGILPVSVLARDLPPSAMVELNDLLHCMARIEHLQLERARAVANHGPTVLKPEAQAAMVGGIDMSLHQAKSEMERLRANICREEAEATTSKLNQWRKNETSIDQLLKATNNMAINDTRGVSDWLESSPAPHDAADLLDDDGIDGPKEFVPGRKWKWNDPNMIAQDPNITPGQVKQSPLVAVKTGEDNHSRPVAPVDPIPHDPGVWLVCHHNGHAQHIHPVCNDIGRVAFFKIIDHQLYIKFAADVDAKLASAVIIREFPATGSTMRFISDNEMTAETTGNDVLQS